MVRLPRGTRKFISVLYLLCRTMGIWDSNIRKALPAGALPLYEAVRAACDALVQFIENDTFDDLRP